MSSLALSITSAKNLDGRLEVFYQGKDDMVIYHNAQAVPNGYWKGEQALTGSVTGWAKNLAVGRNADGRLELFYICTDNHLYRKAQVTANSWDWGSDAPLGGSEARQVAVFNNVDGRLEVFYVGTDGWLYHNRQLVPNGTSWSGESPIRSFAATEIAVERNSDGRLDLFYTRPGDFFRPSGRLYHTWQETPGGSFLRGTPSLGGKARSLAVRQNADQRLELVYIGMNLKLYHNWQSVANGTWHGEEELGGEGSTGLDIRQNADGRLEIFYVGSRPGFPDARDFIYHNWQVTPNQVSGNWSGEEELGRGHALSVGRNADGRLELFYVGDDNQIYHNAQRTANSGWGGAVLL